MSAKIRIEVKSQWDKCLHFVKKKSWCLCDNLREFSIQFYPSSKLTCEDSYIIYIPLSIVCVVFSWLWGIQRGVCGMARKE